MRRLDISKETEILWYGLGEPATGKWLRARDVESSFSGLRFRVVAEKLEFAVESPLVGRINVYNILLASGAALTLGLSVDEIQKGLKEMQRVPGRFERVEEGQPFAVVVDYAHTDDALRNVISVARAMDPKRVITLFGCGGDRDRSKRPLMGMAAGELSDYCSADLRQSAQRGSTRHHERRDGRTEPIRHAPHSRTRSRASDSQSHRKRCARRRSDSCRQRARNLPDFKDGPIPFDDREVARRVLRGFGYGRGKQNAQA